MQGAPYDDLYIYEVNGDARDWAARLGPAYLGLWLEGETSFIFFSQPAEAEIADLTAQSGLPLRERHHMTYEQWQGGLAMEPMLIGELAVVPAWAEYTAQPGQKVLRLDPGLVFGNGLHPTTGHCLQLLKDLADERPLGRVLDLGCGTGILGLAAALLGAESVLAVDLNPLCVTTTANNAAINGLDVEAVEGSAVDYAARPADTVLANVHWAVQEEMFSDPARFSGKRDLILSGLMRSQRGPLEDLVTACGFEILARREAENTWFTLHAQCLGWHSGS